MASIQANLLIAYMRLQRLVAARSTGVNLRKERADTEALAGMFKPLAQLDRQPVDLAGIPGEWITPARVEAGRALLYLHGGYYLLGSLRSCRNVAGNIAAAARARALVIDYRLAPEHPFPAALEDALSAYDRLLAQETQSRQVTLVGDSAGGGLVLATLLALREQGKPLPAGAVCMSPATDLTLSGESWQTNAKKDVVVSRQIAEQIQPLYLRGVNPCDPLASPLFADLRGLPPLLIQVGSSEVVLSDSTRFAERARQAGVDVTLEVWPGMQHVWQYTASFVPEARQAINRIGEFITSMSG